MRLASLVVLGIAASAFAADAPSISAFQTGNTLVTQPADFLAGYAVGVADASQPWSVVPKACVPTGATIVQVRDVVALFLRKHPEVRERGGTLLVRYALSDAFPCPK